MVKSHFTRLDPKTVYHRNLVKKKRNQRKSKENHFAQDNKVSDIAKAMDLIFESSKIKSPQLHHLTIFMGQMQKKYLNF